MKARCSISVFASVVGLASCTADQRIATLGPSFDDAGSSERFTKLAAGQPLPNDATCAARVRRSSWEPRPENVPFNQRVPTAAQLTQLLPWDARISVDVMADVLRKRVSGNFVGTTDEILQWGACKWGFDEDFVRSYALQASAWHQEETAGWTSNSSDCPAGAPTRSAFGATECAQTYGIFQTMWRYTKSAWPMSRDSTAFQVDYSLAGRRSCFEGFVTWLKDSAPADKPYVSNDEWGCIGADFSGTWYNREANGYINAVKAHLAAKPWTTSGF